jgi:hypothetical protein
MTRTIPAAAIPPATIPAGAPPPARPRRGPAVAGALTAAVTFLAYLPGLGRSLDFDSAQTVGMFVKDGPPWSAFRLQAVLNNHPFFSFLEQLVRAVTGRTDAATMRVLPILFGAVAVGVLTWFAARRHGVAAGLVAGALLAANPTFASLSRGVRGYSLLVLCAVVATVLVADDRPGRRRWPYPVVAGIGLATHLYMVPVVVAHAGMVAARRRLDARWRARFLYAGVLGALAYAGMAGAMVEGITAHDRIFQADFPWRVAEMATGGGWASVAAAPLVVAGAVLLLRRSRGSRGAAAALGAALVFLWAVSQSSALTERFFVWLVPGAAYLAAVATGRLRPAALLGCLSAALAASMAASTWTQEPTAYRQAAAVIREANAAGQCSCVVNIGVPPMLAYLDTPADFAALTDPTELDGCDLVVVAAWWPSDRPWFAPDMRVIAAAEARFPERRVLQAADRALVLTRPA